MARILEAARRVWSTVRGRNPRPEPKVIVHDPEAAGPRDLDDVFQDPDVHARVGSLIADSAARKSAGDDGGGTPPAGASSAKRGGGS